MIADGQVRPIIGAEFPIEQARPRTSCWHSGEVSGKVLLRVSATTVQPSEARARTNWSTSAVVV